MMWKIGSGNMELLFNKTCIGYSHIDTNSICQDSSLVYQEEDKSIIVVADGHGGKVYIRSQLGSKLACQAAVEVLKNITLDKELSEDNIKSLKL